MWTRHLQKNTKHQRIKPSPTSSFLHMTSRHLIEQAKDTSKSTPGETDSLWEKQTPALLPYQAWVVIFTLSTWVMLCLSSEIRHISNYAAKIPTPLVQHLPMMSHAARNLKYDCVLDMFVTLVFLNIHYQTVRGRILS